MAALPAHVEFMDTVVRACALGRLVSLNGHRIEHSEAAHCWRDEAGPVLTLFPRSVA